MTDTILIFDTTLRDGEQSPGCSMNIEEKLQVAAQLEELGVDIIEAGFAIAFAGGFDVVSEIERQRQRPIVPARRIARLTKLEMLRETVRSCS